MSRTLSHGRNFQKEPYKNRACGYEFSTRRAWGYPVPGKVTKWITRRKERAAMKKDIQSAQEAE